MHASHFNLLDFKPCIFIFTAHGKHHPPGLEDEIWRLESIGKDGPYQKKLNEENIRTVGDFLFSYFKDSKKLQKVSFYALKTYNILHFCVFLSDELVILI